MTPQPLTITAGSSSAARVTRRATIQRPVAHSSHTAATRISAAGRFSHNSKPVGARFRCATDNATDHLSPVGISDVRIRAGQAVRGSSSGCARVGSGSNPTRVAPRRDPSARSGTARIPSRLANDERRGSGHQMGPRRIFSGVSHGLDLVPHRLGHCNRSFLLCRESSARAASKEAAQITTFTPTVGCSNSGAYEARRRSSLLGGGPYLRFVSSPDSSLPPAPAEFSLSRRRCVPETAPRCTTAWIHTATSARASSSNVTVDRGSGSFSVRAK